MSSVGETVRRSEVRRLSRGEISGPFISQEVGCDPYPEAFREPRTASEQTRVVIHAKLGYLTLGKTN